MKIIIDIVFFTLSIFGLNRVIELLVDYTDKKSKEKARIKRMLNDYEKNKWKRNWSDF